MKIRAADLFSLIESGWDKLQSEYGENHQSMNLDFFNSLARHIQHNSRNKYKLKGATLYKQYYLKIKEDALESQSDFIGVTPIYLSALSHFVHDRPFEEIGIHSISESQEEIPEFPPNHPSFPSSPTLLLPFYSIIHPEKIHQTSFSDFTKTILKEIGENENIQLTENTMWIKDESINPTGTHKDRMAWEIYLWYENEIKRQINSPEGKIALKSLSLISTGSAAYAIQDLLNKKGLPNLRVLMNQETSEELINRLQEKDCKIYLCDLDSTELNSKEILEKTDNINGIDITYGKEFDSLRAIYYDWLSYEVLNQNPDWVFIPFGTGDLFTNVISTNSREMDKKVASKRFFGNKQILSKCNFIGAANNRKSSKMKMLYSAFQNKAIDAMNRKITNLIVKSHCSKTSRVIVVKEQYLDSAIEIAEYFALNFEPSAISGLGLFLQLSDNNDIHIKSNEKVIFINTGKCKD